LASGNYVGARRLDSPRPYPWFFASVPVLMRMRPAPLVADTAAALATRDRHAVLSKAREKRRGSHVHDDRLGQRRLGANCLLVPGIDDGARDLDDAVELARKAEANGVVAICARRTSIGLTQALPETSGLARSA
jgi:hypothetical protein